MNTETSTPVIASETDTDTLRLQALAAHLEVETDDLITSRYDDACIEYGRDEFLVLTDDEADERCRDAMRDSLWAFNASFLSRYVPALRNARAEKAWAKAAAELCEDAGPLVEALLGDRLDEALDDAAQEDGRGHFLAGYDGDEREAVAGGVRFYIYRTN